MLSHRTQPVHALVATTYVASLGISITTPITTPTRPFSLSNTIDHRSQYEEYRKACYLLASMAKSVQDTADSLGVLGSPVKLTCGVALTLVGALEVSSETLHSHDSSLTPHTGHGCQSSIVLGPRRIGHHAFGRDS